MSDLYSIHIYKQYLNFSASHFLIFSNGEREPLHGHNYRVSLRGKAPLLQADMVFDFLDIKPIAREVCDSLDHCLLLPKENPMLEVTADENNYLIKVPDGSTFSFPKKDVLFLPLPNTSAERLAIYLANEIESLVKKRFNFQFSELEIEVEETPGQSATYLLECEKR